MSRITLVGAGPLGRAALPHLLAADHEVTLVTRSGTGLPDTRAVAADATSEDLAARLPAADALLIACNFPYGRWPRDWPPAITRLLDLAARDGARVVLAGSMYSYARPTAQPLARPMSDRDPLVDTWVNGRIRKQVWEQVLAARADGRIPGAVEVRGSDYIGPRTGSGAHGGDRVLEPALAGRTLRPIGDPDLPHTWTATEDFGRLLARAVRDEAMEGRAWHVPSAPAVSLRELVRTALATIGRHEEPRIAPVPTPLLRLLGLLSADTRRLAEATYQFTSPWRMDDRDARTLLGEEHTPLEVTLRAAMDALQEPAPAR